MPHKQKIYKKWHGFMLTWDKKYTLWLFPSLKEKFLFIRKTVQAENVCALKIKVQNACEIKINRNKSLSGIVHIKGQQWWKRTEHSINPFNITWHETTLYCQVDTDHMTLPGSGQGRWFSGEGCLLCRFGDLSWNCHIPIPHKGRQTRLWIL